MGEPFWDGDNTEKKTIINKQDFNEKDQKVARSIQCSKCKLEYSTKEAKRLHTCNSILDQHYLSVENSAERAIGSKLDGDSTEKKTILNQQGNSEILAIPNDSVYTNTDIEDNTSDS